MNLQFPSPVTTIFSRRVRPGSETKYEEWLQGITQTVSRFPGNQGSTILPPGPGRSEYITFVQFDSAENLKNWMHSKERFDWCAKLEEITIDSEEVSSLTGMERWFTLPDRAVTQAPPKYKSAALVILGLYPLLLILGPLLNPIVGTWPQGVRVLASLLVSVPIMVWVIMPQLTRLFFAWLYPKPKARRHPADA